MYCDEFTKTWLETPAKLDAEASAHLEGCATCRRAVRQLEDLGEVIAGLAPPPIPARVSKSLDGFLAQLEQGPASAPRRRWWEGFRPPARLRWASGLALACLLALLLWTPRQATREAPLSSEVLVRLDIEVEAEIALAETRFELALPEGVRLAAAAQAGPSPAWMEDLRAGSNRISVFLVAGEQGRWPLHLSLSRGASRHEVGLELVVRGGALLAAGTTGQPNRIVLAAGFGAGTEPPKEST